MGLGVWGQTPANRLPTGLRSSKLCIKVAVIPSHCIYQPMRADPALIYELKESALKNESIHIE